MKCYKHPKSAAVGVCHECGEGICGKCAVKIGGKLYCKSDADKVFGEKKAESAPAAQAPKQSAKAMRSSVLGMSSTAWMLAIAGWFIFPAVCWGLGLILGYVALSKASDNLNVFSKRDVAVCGIGALMNLAFLIWWGVFMVDLISMFD
ncbi:MAG: hypothetical protein QXU82_01315 [Candidatus Aenigmatarchaeota archaeon]